MSRTTATSPRPQRHLPGCPGWHDTDISCTDMLDAQEAEARDERLQPTPATWDCHRAPSRTQPNHEFDHSEGLPDDETECVHGCGVTWDRLRGVE